jgi:ubiquinone/menaquinone biosynthesis C-methylase UbiE
METAVRTSESRFFDGLAHRRGRFNPFTDRGWETLAGSFRRAMAGVEPERRLLDIGCGTGESLRVYRDWTSDYTGIDISLGSIALAASSKPDRRWIAGDANQLPFRDESFDVIAFSSVLHHIPDFHIALREAHRILRSGGRVFAFDPNLLNPAMCLFRHPRSPLYSRQGVSPNERPLRPRELESAFLAAGFYGIHQRCQSDISYRQVAPRLLDAGIRLFNWADRWWDVSGLGRRFGTFVITWASRPAEVRS